jgi:hypothetical protein
MATIVNNLTISGFKVFGSDCDPNTSDIINTTIPPNDSSSIYQYQAVDLTSTNLVSSGTGPSEPPVITLTKVGDTSKIAGGKTVDTLSIMLKCNVATAGSTPYILINGNVAQRGVGYSSSTVGGYALPDWNVYPPQSKNGNVPSNTPSGNSPAYTVNSIGAGPHTLTQVNLSGTYLNNYALNVVEGLNRVFIQVYDDDARTTLLGSYSYVVSIVSSSTQLASLVPTLVPVPATAPGYSYSPAFNSYYCSFTNLSYTLNVLPSTTQMSLTPTTVVTPTTSGQNGEQVITIYAPGLDTPVVLKSTETSEVFDVSTSDIISVIVTAADGVTQQTYTIGVDFDLGNNNLFSAGFSYYQNNNSVIACDSASASWKSGTVYGRNPTTANLELYTIFNYINTIPNDQLGMIVNLTAVDLSSTITISVNTIASGVTVVGSGQFIIDTSSLVIGLNTISCSCTSELGQTKIYTFNFLVGSASSALQNITVDGGVFDSINSFDPLNTATYDTLALLKVASEAGDLPTYSIYVNPSSSTSSIQITSSYSDLGSRISYNEVTGVGSWSPSPINNYNTTSDNWTEGSSRFKSVSVSASTGISKSLTIATYVPEGLYNNPSSGLYSAGVYYGYRLNIYKLPAGLINLNLFSSSDGSPIALNPSFQSPIQNYAAYIGNKVDPTNVVDITVSYGYGSNYVVDYSTSTSGSYTVANQLKNGVQTTAELGSGSPQREYIIYVRIFSVSAPTSALSWYKLNLLNIDRSLVLASLDIKTQSAQSTTTNKYPNPPTPGAVCTLSPALNSSGSGFYNVPVPSLYCYMKPVVTDSSVKTITVTIGSAPAQAVKSGTPVNFEMTGTSVSVVITISDNLTPENFNTYLINVYSTSTNTDLAVVNFTDQVILGTDFTANLPNGTTITSISAGTFEAETSVTGTRITASPVQTGCVMTLSYVKETASSTSPLMVGYETLISGVPSSLIPLIPGTTQNVQVFVQPNLSTEAPSTYNFDITQIEDANSSLSNIEFTNCSTFIFNSALLNYSLSLINGNTTFQFTPTAASEYYDTIVYSYNGAAPVSIDSGDESASINADNYAVLTVTVTAQDGTFTTYTFNITRPINSFLTGLKLYTTRALAIANGTNGLIALNPATFSSIIYSYAAEVGSGQDNVWAVVTHSSESSVDMSNGTNDPTITTAEVWSIPVTIVDSTNVLAYQVNPNTITVSAASIAPHVYQLAVFRERPTAVARDIQLNVYDPASTDPFKRGAFIPLNDINGESTEYDSYNYTYTIPVSYQSQTIVVSVTGQGANAYSLQAVTYYEPTNCVITISEPILVKVQSLINTSEINTYQFSLFVPEPSALSLRRMNLRRK